MNEGSVHSIPYSDTVMPKSSTMSKGTVASDSMNCQRVPSANRGMMCGFAGMILKSRMARATM
jgi:hypothetical protein